MAFEFPDLPYDFSALEPHVDAKTMEIHYGKHHKTYFDKFTDAVDGTAMADQTLEAVMGGVDGGTSAAVRNNGGGFYNHIIYWNSMCKGGSEPDSDLSSAIDSAFGSMSDLKTKIKEAGVGQFGSGFAWLIKADGKLQVTSTPNQDNPLMKVADTQGTPLLGMDVWEHAYYLHYQNKRPDYIDAWLDIVDWAKVSERFAAA